MKSRPSFTLIELLLYISLTAIITFSVSSFLVVTIDARVKNQTVAEVEQQGQTAMVMMTQAIRNAQGINSPALGEVTNTLSLDVIEVSKDPTTFTLAAGQLWVQEGVAPAVALTNTRIRVMDMSFIDLSRSSQSRSVRINLVLNYFNTSGRNIHTYTKVFQAAANPRP
ncbi:MAG: hypothetical protein HYY50_00230 [Candidatus Kerfeldbacteria bacterium]|nr:hypothetical protein [Candidatus Kerfeldbacteria bacterium]